MNMLKSICFILCFVSLWIGLILLKKTDKEQRTVVWAPVCFLAILCYHALIAGIINWMHVPIGLTSMLAADLLLDIIIWYRILRSKERQKLCFSLYDGIALAVIAGVTFLGAVNQFGIRLDIRYLTTDPGTHYRQALVVLQSHQVSGMYFAPLNNALFLELFQPVLRATRLYRAFILADITMYFVSGTMFFALIRDKIQNRYMQVMSILLAAGYMLGYPRNNMVFGFVYLGMGISIIMLLVFLANHYIESKECSRFFAFFMVCGTISIGICYSLFAPVVFSGIALAMTVDIWLRRTKTQKISQVLVEILKKNLMIFLIPCALILSYSMFSLNDFGSELSAGIVQEGFVYRDLFSNFMVVLPFALYGCYLILRKIKAKKIKVDAALPMAGVLLVFMFLLAYLGTKGMVSSYYFYKNHYLMIFLLFYFTFYGIAELAEHHKALTSIYAGMVGVLAVVWFGGWEIRFQEDTVLFAPELKSNYYFHVYNFNRDALKGMQVYPEGKIQLYEAYYQNFKTDEEMIFNGHLEDYNWFRGIAGRVDYDKNICWTDFTEEEIRELTKPGITTAISKEDKSILDAEINHKDMLPVYLKASKQEEKEGMLIVVMNEEPGSADYRTLDYADHLEILFENEAGCIATLKNIERNNQ